MHPSSTLCGKVAIVTGASQGIGRAIALALASEGARVLACGRSLAGLEGTAQAAPDLIVARVCDVTSAADVQGLVAAAEREFGGLDVLVNNAGVEFPGPLTDITEEAWDATMDTNVKGMFFGCKYAMPAMARRGGGSIVNIGSVASFTGERWNAAYVASKGAVLMLTKSAACEFAEAGVRVNVICPGATATPMMEGLYEAVGRESGERWMAGHQPLTGILAPEDVAKAAVFLASDDSKGMTGSSIVVDGGLSASWDHGPRPG
jgi:NAD(P)-dependent dehydrogenase (short-subunit alcohol dehydrogenase family)